jgi:hypothetical protein
MRRRSRHPARTAPEAGAPRRLAGEQAELGRLSRDSAAPRRNLPRLGWAVHA